MSQKGKHNPQGVKHPPSPLRGISMAHGNSASARVERERKEEENIPWGVGCDDPVSCFVFLCFFIGSRFRSAQTTRDQSVSTVVCYGVLVEMSVPLSGQIPVVPTLLGHSSVNRCNFVCVRWYFSPARCVFLFFKKVRWYEAMRQNRIRLRPLRT